MYQEIHRGYLGKQNKMYCRFRAQQSPPEGDVWGEYWKINLTYTDVKQKEEY